MRHFTVKVDEPDLTLLPICDVQIGAAGVDIDGFREHMEYAKGLPNPRFIGVGDYTDGVSPSNRAVLLSEFSRGGLYDTARDMLDAAATKQAEEFIRLTVDTAGQWDTMLKGHHFWPFADGVRTTDHLIAEALQTPYAGGVGSAKETAVITYIFPSARAKKQRPFLRVYVAHGEGGGATYAGPLNQLERMMRGFNADVYIVGHHHKLVAARATKLSEDPTKPTQLQKTDSLLIGAGSWMRGYMPDESTYAENGMMVPLALGAPIIRIHRRADNSFRIRAEV